MERVLDERVFEHILGIIRMQTRQMEQSPRTYAGMGEEDRRQTIVATLNTRYAGRDTKLAIVMFVREKGLTAILKKAKDTLEQHRSSSAGRAQLRRPNYGLK